MTAGPGLIPIRSQSLELDYQGVVSAVFLMREPLSSYYWMPVVDSGATAQGVIEMSNLVPLERSDGLYVTYLVNYTHRTSALFARDRGRDAGRLPSATSRTLFPDAGGTHRRRVPVPGAVRRADLDRSATRSSGRPPTR